jgi:hypothetical protein
MSSQGLGDRAMFVSATQEKGEQSVGRQARDRRAARYPFMNEVITTIFVCPQQRTVRLYG